MEAALLERLTLDPAAGAALDRVTVQVVVEDAGTLVLGHISDVRVMGAVTVSDTSLLVPL